jgi:hypothetical protein
VPWSTGTIAGDTGVWKRYIRTAAKQRPGKSDLKLVRHETLVARPETELRGLCEFLHLPFDPAMLAFHEREPVTLNFRREPWKARAGQAIDSETNERWREQLSPAQVEEIEQLAWREMYRFGYKPATKLTTLLAATGRRVGRAFLRRARTRLTGQSIAAW